MKNNNSRASLEDKITTTDAGEKNIIVYIFNIDISSIWT
jgi:hypothetical protein